MESRLIVPGRTVSRGAQGLTSILGAVALLAALGSASVFAGDPLVRAVDPGVVVQELPIGGVVEPIVVIPPQPVPTPETGLETRADGSIWWCPPTTEPFQLRVPCRMVSSATGIVVQDRPDAGAADPPTAPEPADAAESDSDDSTSDQTAIAEPEFALPPTDTDPAVSRAGTDGGTAALIAIVLYAFAWGARHARESSTRR